MYNGTLKRTSFSCVQDGKKEEKSFYFLTICLFVVWWEGDDDDMACFYACCFPSLFTTSLCLIPFWASFGILSWIFYFIQSGGSQSGQVDWKHEDGEKWRGILVGKGCFYSRVTTLALRKRWRDMHTMQCLHPSETGIELITEGYRSEVVTLFAKKETIKLNLFKQTTTRHLAISMMKIVTLKYNI